MTILVTGGTGLVGDALRAVLRDRDAVFVGSSTANLESWTETCQLFSRVKPTAVIHLAAVVGGLFANRDANLEFFERSCAINDNVVRACRKHDVKRLVACLSTCVFPDAIASYPITEDQLHNGPPHPSNAGYAYAKRALEVHVRLHNRPGWVSVIPTNVYGSNDNFSLEKGHAVASLIHRCVLAKRTGQPFRVRGTGSALRQFIYAPDLARLLVWTLDNYDDPTRPLILAGDEQVSIRELAHTIARHVGHTGPVEFSGIPSEDGQIRKTASNDRLRALTAFAFTSLDDGIRHTVAGLDMQRT